MATVAISITNGSSVRALVQLYSWSMYKVNLRAGGWVLGPGESTVAFDDVVDTLNGNQWWVQFTDFDDAVYGSNGGSMVVGYITTETSLMFTVDKQSFHVPLAAQVITAPMQKTGEPKAITNVFVLMLENRSFDHLFAKSGIPGITTASSSASNSYNGTEYLVSSPAPYTLTTDPPHEFMDVLQQLTGYRHWTHKQDYPATNMSGFVKAYAVSASEDTGLPQADRVGDVMKCCDPSQVPVLTALAKEFALCDHWFSSMPGPTWPNRYFVHAASSANMDDSPPGVDAPFLNWVDGISFQNGTVYNRLKHANLQYRLYNDYYNSFADSNPGTSTVYGNFAQVATLEDVTSIMVHDINDFATDLRLQYPYAYTFIEPNYGDVYDDTFANGSSQHPMDGLGGGEALIKFVYEQIRSSPLWYTSLLIITYDEHGGLYDSVSPPAATPPGDSYKIDLYDSHEFKFDVYGPRVPAVVVSPLISKGTVSATVFDHSSVVATISSLFGTHSLTDRDKHANPVDPLATLSIAADTVRTDCLTTLPEPVRQAPAASPAPERREAARARKLPERGKIYGFIAIAAKTEYELLGKTPEARALVEERVKSLRTIGDAEDYAMRVNALLDEHRGKQAAK